MNKRLENKLKEPFNIVVRLFSSNISYSEKKKRGEKKKHTPLMQPKLYVKRKVDIGH